MRRGRQSNNDIRSGAVWVVGFVKQVFRRLGVRSVSNLIDFLERLGQDAELRYAGGEVVEEALCAAGIEPDLRVAILAKDQRALEALLGADTNVCSLIHKEDEEEEEEEEEDDEEEDDEEEEESDDEVDMVSRRHVADRAA
jgi:hypothetical protein